MSLVNQTPQLVSPDQLKNWSRCRKKFYYQYVRQLNWPTDTRRFDLGQDVHKLMEYQARGLDVSAVLADARDDVRACYLRLYEHPAVHWPVVASEWGFLIPVADTFWLTGRIDRVSYDPNTDTLWIVDWKTGTAAPRFPEQDWQTIVYRYAVVEAYDDLRQQAVNVAFTASCALPARVAPEQVKFLYLEVRPAANVSDQTLPLRELVVSYDRDTHEKSRAYISKHIDQIAKTTEYVLPERCPDKFCPYLSICGV